MSTLNQIRHGISRAWESLAVGWRELRERANDALTQFRPGTESGDVQTRQERRAVQAARWGLLAAEIADNGEEIDVTLEIPGLEPGDFDIEIIDDVLVVRGEKRVSREEKRGQFHVLERAYGQFERAMRLPAPVDDSQARASYRRGVLRVSLPKTAAARMRRIPVESR